MRINWNKLTVNKFGKKIKKISNKLQSSGVTNLDFHLISAAGSFDEAA